MEPERLVLSAPQFGHSVGDGRWIGTTRTLLVSTYAEPGSGINLFTMSPDGSLIAYLSDEAGANDIYVQPTHGGSSRIRVSNGGASGGRWSRNGRELYCWNHRSILTVTVVPSAPALAVLSSREIAGAIVRARGADEGDGLFDVAPDGHLLVAQDVAGLFSSCWCATGSRI